METRQTVEVWNDRTERLIGAESVERLQSASVLVVGVGGVGGYAAEMLARTGIGHLTLVDADAVAQSNINRQLIATHSSVGESKVVLFAERFHDINPEASIDVRMDFLTADNLNTFFCDKNYDYVIDAIDTVSPKVALIAHCLRHNIPIISSMGAGGRIDPTRIGYFDLWETREDGLARAVRQKMKSMFLRRPLKVVASTEKPSSHSLVKVETLNKRTSYGTIASIPAIFGIYLANHVIRRITGI
ncbi:MAG: tRNA threonylcarbamoyladenosine dehydratase [Muribaculaceae bacterium]|nr:tRNA threonylcarbamoyladenosine dehydratase [Muribaculaceae bacterium]